MYARPNPMSNRAASPPRIDSTSSSSPSATPSAMPSVPMSTDERMCAPPQIAVTAQSFLSDQRCDRASTTNGNEWSTTHEGVHETDAGRCAEQDQGGVVHGRDAASEASGGGAPGKLVRTQPPCSTSEVRIYPRFELAKSQFTRFHHASMYLGRAFR